MKKTTNYLWYGPPGSGKTTEIMRTAEEYVKRFGSDMVSIVSFARASIREVAGRDSSVDPENITTLHARAKRRLYAKMPAEDLIGDFIADCPAYAAEGCIPDSLLKRHPKRNGDEDKDELGYTEIRLSGGGKTLYDESQVLRQLMIPIEKWQNKSAAKWHTVWAEWCKSKDVMDFTGWLEAVLKNDVLPPQNVLFVDEAQDHTPLQLAVVRAWPCETRILVGDDDQNLYEWSGAIPSAFFKSGLGEEERILSQSYRVPRAVHEISQSWVRSLRERREKEYAPRDAEGKVSIGEYSLKQASSGRFPPGLLQDDKKTYMVLASCGYMLDDIIQLMRDYSIPFHNPYRKRNSKWNPIETVAGYLSSFLVHDRLWTGEEALKWASILKTDVYQWRKREAFRRLCAERGFDTLLMEDLSKHFSPQGLDQIMKRDTSIFLTRRRKETPGSWRYALKALEKWPGAFWNPRVVVGTIHSVKGGEADVVYLSPDLSPAANAEYKSQAYEDRITRLFYVGMTRAREELNLLNPGCWTAVDW